MATSICVAPASWKPRIRSTMVSGEPTRIMPFSSRYSNLTGPDLTGPFFSAVAYHSYPGGSSRFSPQRRK